jgi:hypothetical protein
MASDNDDIMLTRKIDEEKRLSPKQGISWRELQAAIFATTRSRQYRSCMEIKYIKCKRINFETQENQFTAQY